jgi:hypothetical protein
MNLAIDLTDTDIDEGIEILVTAKRDKELLAILDNHKLIGQLYPWKRNDKSEPIISLMVTFDYALLDIREAYDRSLTESEFRAILRRNGISDTPIKLDDLRKEIKKRDGSKYV